MPRGANGLAPGQEMAENARGAASVRPLRH